MMRTLFATTVFALALAVSPSAFASGRIAFTAAYSGNPDVWTIDRGGGNPTDLTPNSPAVDQTPAWSPDGSRIAFGRYNPDWQATNVHELWTVRPDGTQPIEVTRFSGYSAHPSWSPDGSQIVFQLSGPFDVTRSSLETTTPDGSLVSAVK